MSSNPYSKKTVDGAICEPICFLNALATSFIHSLILKLLIRRRIFTKSSIMLIKTNTLEWMTCCKSRWKVSVNTVHKTVSPQLALNEKERKEAAGHRRKVHCFRPNRPSPSVRRNYATHLPLASSSVSYDVQRRNLVFHHLRNSIKGQRTNFWNNRFSVFWSKNRFGRHSEHVYGVCGFPRLQEEEERVPMCRVNGCHRQSACLEHSISSGHGGCG